MTICFLTVLKSFLTKLVNKKKTFSVNLINTGVNFLVFNAIYFFTTFFYF